MTSRDVVVIVRNELSLCFCVPGYDIAVLRLETTLSFNDRVSALCMPDAITELPDRCVLSGWGDTSGFGKALLYICLGYHLLGIRV